MASTKQRISNCLWFDTEAEEAAKLYTSIFKNSSINNVAHYVKEGQEIHHKPEGSVMTVTFILDGQEFMALNGGPIFKFNEAISLMIDAETQEEIDYYWEKLTANGGQEGPCGWLKDKFGLSWQVVPQKLMAEMMTSGETEKIERVTKAYMQMKKFDIATLKKAYNGE